MATSSTTFGKDSQPETRRGKSKKTIILNAIRSESMIDFADDDSLTDVENRDRAEAAFFTHIANRAFNPSDEGSGMCLKLLADKGWSSVKPSSDYIEFDFDKDAKPHIQASQVMKATADGLIPPDIANMFVSSIASMMKIEEVTEISRRLAEIEKALGVG